VLFHRASLERPDETELAATDVSIGTTARFDVDTRTLGGPGTGRLLVRFAGTGAIAPESESVPLERRALAHLSLASTPLPSDPTEGIELPVGVGSITGAVRAGWVEAMADGKSAGISPVADGASHVVATFAPTRGKPASITLRYVASGAGWVAGDPLVIDVPVRPPSPWRGTPWLVTACAVAYWVIRSWRRPESMSRGRKREPVKGETARASVEVLEVDRDRTGWRGRVLDAHDETPIAGARLCIVVPVFDGEGIAANQLSAADGSFVIPHVAAARNEGSRLVVSAPMHATLTVPAPKDGRLSVNLVSRRRALLERFVTWARRGGAWPARRGEPTPLEVAGLARRRQDPAAAEWATALAEAAYGPSPPDERREAEILAREPPIDVTDE
jgi:hypothetical protein